LFLPGQLPDEAVYVKLLLSFHDQTSYEHDSGDSADLSPLHGGSCFKEVSDMSHANGPRLYNKLSLVEVPFNQELDRVKRTQESRGSLMDFLDTNAGFYFAGKLDIGADIA